MLNSNIIKYIFILKIDPSILEDYKIVDTVGAGDCFTSAFTVSFYRSLIEFGPAKISSMILL